MGKQIQRSGSAVPLVQPVLDPEKVFLDVAYKLLPEGSVHILKFVELEVLPRHVRIGWTLLRVWWRLPG